MTDRRLTHVRYSGEASMVDVSAKADTHRAATAEGCVRMRRETLAAVRRNQVAKGDVLSVARIAGIMAAKRTAELIPLCHPLPLTDVQVDVRIDDALPGLRVVATARTVGKTGVEMEAITAVAVSCITAYDMVKSLDREALITDVRLVEKQGGKSGRWRRPDGTGVAPTDGDGEAAAPPAR
jgi:cyclic pyranopterin phosphate synthase